MDNAPATITREGDDIHLSWSPVVGADGYQVWQSSSPYFSPGDSSSTLLATLTGPVETSYIHTTTTSSYYLIIAQGCSCAMGVSTRIGVFIFPFSTQSLLSEPVTLGATVVAEYTFDGDGNRVKAVVNGETTYYPYPHYEETEGSGYTQYYSAASGLVSFRRSGYPQNNGLRYVFRDHLGSTSVIVNGGGIKLWEDRYRTFGELRYTWNSAADGNMPVQTPMRYTGQRFDDAIGLYYYNARYYDPALGRFAQADTIVPEPGDPQSLNRYSYVGNNPLRFIDPAERDPAVVRLMSPILAATR